MATGILHCYSKPANSTISTVNGRVPSSENEPKVIGSLDPVQSPLIELRNILQVLTANALALRYKHVFIHAEDD